MKHEAITVHFRLPSEESKRLAEFMHEQEIDSPNKAARVLLLGALNDFPKWGVTKADRMNAMYLVRKQMMDALLTKLGEVEQEVKDELVLAEASLAHQT